MKTEDVPNTQLVAPTTEDTETIAAQHAPGDEAIALEPSAAEEVTASEIAELTAQLDRIIEFLKHADETGLNISDYGFSALHAAINEVSAKIDARRLQ